MLCDWRDISRYIRTRRSRLCGTTPSRRSSSGENERLVENDVMRTLRVCSARASIDDGIWWWITRRVWVSLFRYRVDHSHPLSSVCFWNTTTTTRTKSYTPSLSLAPILFLLAFHSLSSLLSSCGDDHITSPACFVGDDR